MPTHNISYTERQSFLGVQNLISICKRVMIHPPSEASLSSFNTLRSGMDLLGPYHKSGGICTRSQIIIFNLQVLAENFCAPRLAGQVCQPRHIFTSLPSTHGTRGWDFHTIHLVNSSTPFSNFRSTLDILIIARQCTLATLNLRTRRRRLDMLCACLQCLQQFNYAFGCEILVVIVVDLNHWCIDTCAETFDFDESKKSIFSSVARGDPEMIFDCLDYFIATAASKLAWSLQTSN